MAFPSVVATTTGGASADTLNAHPVNIPSGNVSGALLVAIFVNDGTATVSGWPAGWTTLLASEQDASALSRWEIRYKVSAGNETAFNLTTSASESSASITYLITGWDSATAPAIGTTVKASTSTPNPPSLDPAGWATEDTLWIAVQGWDDGRTTCNTSPQTPSPFSTPVVARPNTAAAGCGAAAAHLASAVASIDPGTFGNSASDPTQTNLIAVRPSAVVAAASLLLPRTRDLVHSTLMRR